MHSTEEQELVDNFPYRPLIGALLYLSMNTRPDISYAVGVLSRFSTKVNITVCKLMMYLMQYVRGTTDKGIHYIEGEILIFICSLMPTGQAIR